MEFFTLFFSITGRIGRLRFWVGWLTLLVLGNGASLLLRDQFDSLAEPQLVDLALTLLLLWPDFCVGRKRLADRGRGLGYALAYSGYSLVASVLIYFAPFLSGAPDGSLEFNLFWAWLITFTLFFTVECGCMPGTEGPNAYGPQPAQP